MRVNKKRIKENELTDEERRALFYESKKGQATFKMSEGIEIKEIITEEGIADAVIKDELIQKQVEHIKRVEGEVIDNNKALQQIKDNPKNISAVLANLLNKPITDEMAVANNLPVGFDRKWVVAVKLIQMAESGDLAAIKTLLDRTEGRVPNENNSRTLKINANSGDVKDFIKLISGEKNG